MIPGRLPGMNEFIDAQRANRFKGANLKKSSQLDCARYIKKQMKGIDVKTPIRLHYTFVERNKRRDLDNISGFAHKVIQDALVQVGVLPNDGWEQIHGYTDSFMVDAHEPRIIVTIEEI